ncbi:MAG: dipeptidase, partial [Planctomycetes bacterium]|nr:dipeptidase [Planctomycetota bacterium]
MNDAIQEVRQVALDVLKPTKAQLEHGLELHASSIVFESYGFSPHAAVDGDALKAAIEAGATDAELRDMRYEMQMTRQVTDPAEREEWKRAWEAAGVTCLFQHAGMAGQTVKRTLKWFAHYTCVTDRMRDFITKAVTPDDIVEAKRQGRRCFYISLNGLPLTEEWNCVEEELRFIRIFFQLGARQMHLAYNRRNMVADGCAEPSNGGLSDFGRAVIAEMNRVGVIPDVAHTGLQSCLDAARCSTRPVVASHTACQALNAHCRCKTDEVIRAIADTGGYVGICCIPAFLGGTGDLCAMLDHIDYVVKRFGADHVAIGTDVAHESRNAAAEQKKVPR